MFKRFLTAAASLLLAGFFAAQPAAAQQEGSGLVAKATEQARTMQADPQMRALLAQARGVLLVPEYGHGAFIVGGKGGEGVLLVRGPARRWSHPVFYGLGGVSIGLQAGGNTGQVAYILMSPEAVRRFEAGNNFSLGAGAGLNVVNYQTGEHLSSQPGDIVAWHNTTGLYGGADVGATDVSYDGRLTSDYYGAQNVGIRQVLDGQVTNSESDQLRTSLP